MMNNYHFVVDNIPRKLNLTARLKAFGSWEKLTLNGKSQPGNNIEFCFRLSSPDSFAEDFQNGKRYTAPFPNCFIKMPREVYHAKPFQPRSGFYFIYDESVVPALQMSGISLKNVSIPLKMSAELFSHMESINHLAEKLYTPGNIDRIDCEALFFLQKIMLQSHDEEKIDEFYLQKINNIASEIHCHYKQKIDLKQLIRKYGLSRRTFFRQWNKIFPVTVKQLQIQLRMNEAPLLLQEDQQISEVSHLLGFNNPSSFIRFFRNYYGKTPSKYLHGLKSKNFSHE